MIKSIKCFWFGGLNFGDSLCPLILKTMFPKSEITWTPNPPKLLCIGSILQVAQSGDTIWGVGAMVGDSFSWDKGKPKTLNILAVRGPLTRNLCIKEGFDCPEVYGDPAILLGKIYPKKRQNTFDLGVVAHYVDTDSGSLKCFNDCGLKVLNIPSYGRPVEDVISDIVSCSVIASSSLHGLIVAESYGIPSVWIEFSDNVAGSGFKFRDYYFSTDRDSTPVNCRESFQTDFVYESALDMSKPVIDCDKLVESFKLVEET